MPLVSLHLVQLDADRVTLSDYVGQLLSPAPSSTGSSSTSPAPLIVARAVRWIIKPERLSTDTLLSTQWDLFIVAPASSPLQRRFTSPPYVRRHWSIKAGVPGRLLDDFQSKNRQLLFPQSTLPLTGSLQDNPRMAKSGSTQGLELNDELREWAYNDFGKASGKGAVSMFNLLAFKPGKEAHESYLRYGKAFAERIGSTRGGQAKIVGKVVKPGSSSSSQKDKDEDDAGWDEVALAHYPSIHHFVDMLASEDYQEVNHRDRLPALKDTCILCTTELDPVILAAKEGTAGAVKSKL